MRIFDCVIYNGERDVLTLRLSAMARFVDFLCVFEAPVTFSGSPKPLTFERDFPGLAGNPKVKYFVVDNFSDCVSAWDREYRLRDAVRSLVDARDDDLLIVADVDEILNLEFLLQQGLPSEPVLIELPAYYYYANVRSSEKILVTLVGSFGKLRCHYLGNRRLYKEFAPRVIRDENGCNGGHFTYLFGDDWSRYVSKLVSFSHQEYSGSYFTDIRRIAACVDFNLDLFERDCYTLTTVSIDSLPLAVAAALNSNDSLRKYVRTSSIRQIATRAKKVSCYVFWRWWRRCRYGRVVAQHS